MYTPGPCTVGAEAAQLACLLPAGVLSILNEHESTSHLPIGVKTMAASASAGAFRIFLMPVDAVKTIMQVGADSGAGCIHRKDGASASDMSLP